MPLYEYECILCRTRREVLQKYGEPPPACPKCDEAMKKRISVGSFSLKGEGWARDNYGLTKEKAKK